MVQASQSPFLSLTREITNYRNELFTNTISFDITQTSKNGKRKKKKKTNRNKCNMLIVYVKNAQINSVYTRATQGIKAQRNDK